MEDTEETPEVYAQYYISTENSDRTEGMGKTITTLRTIYLHAAIKQVQGRGTMWDGPGDVYLVKLMISKDGTITESKEKVYGEYWIGDERVAAYADAANDPEYETYLKLKRKFEEK